MTVLRGKTTVRTGIFKVAVKEVAAIGIQRIERRVIPPAIAAIGVGRGRVDHAVVARTSRDAEVIGRPVVAVAAAVFTQRGAGGAGVIGEL